MIKRNDFLCIQDHVHIRPDRQRSEPECVSDRPSVHIKNNWSVHICGRSKCWNGTLLKVNHSGNDQLVAMEIIMFKLFICMILLFGYSRVHVDVTDTGAVDRTTYGVFTLEWMVFWTVPHSVAFQCEHGRNVKSIYKKTKKQKLAFCY